MTITRVNVLGIAGDAKLMSGVTPSPAKSASGSASWRLLALVIFLGLCSVEAHSQELEPRTYTNLPVGLNFAGLGYAYSEGEVNAAPSVPIEDAELTLQVTGAAYVRSVDLWGRAGNITAAWGRACVEGSALLEGERVRGDRCGSTDPSLRVAYMFYGAPAMTMEAFRRTAVGRVIGLSLKVSAPWGDYSNENIINSGSNRWTIKPEIGASNRWGKWSVDAAFGVRLFTDNDNFKGSVTLEQDPLYQVQLHLIYDLPKRWWIALNGNYFWGGETRKDGIRADDRQENSRLGLTLALPLTRQQSLKLYASRGIVTSIGNDSDTVGVLWQYRWQ